MIVYTSETGVPTERELDAQRRQNAAMIRDAFAASKYARTPIGQINRIYGALSIKADNDTATVADFERAMTRIINLLPQVGEDDAAWVEDTLAEIRDEIWWAKQEGERSCECDGCAAGACSQ